MILRFSDARGRIHPDCNAMGVPRKGDIVTIDGFRWRVQTVTWVTNNEPSTLRVDWIDIYMVRLKG